MTLMMKIKESYNNGSFDTSIAIARKALMMGYSIDEVMELCTLPKKKITQLQRELEKQDTKQDF